MHHKNLKILSKIKFLVQCIEFASIIGFDKFLNRNIKQPFLVGEELEVFFSHYPTLIREVCQKKIQFSWCNSGTKRCMRILRTP